MTLALRPYQLEAVEAIWNEMATGNPALCAMSTGAGKTEVAIALVQRAVELRPNIRVVMLMDRVDLVTQTARRFSKVLGAYHVGVWCRSLGRKELSRTFTVASVQSADVKQFGAINLIIVDEVHMMNQAESYYTKFIEYAQMVNPSVRVVGLTATPYRSDGPIHGEGKFFRRVCYRKGIQELIAMGFLCRPVLKQGEHAFDTSALRTRAGEYVAEDVDKLVSDEEVLREQLRDALLKMQGRRSVAWACANIDHCERVMEALRGMSEEATCVHSQQDRTVRDRNLALFTGGGCRHMVFVSVLSQGFDHPPIDCVVFLRPTRSPVLYVQTAGRGLRISTGKETCLILDYGQVVRELGPLDDPKVKGGKGEGGEAVMKVCGTCSSWVPGGCRVCPDCEAPFPEPLAPEEKLTKRADTNAAILSQDQAPETEEVGPVYAEMHKSKSGNDCVKLTYSYGGMRNVWGGRDGVAEFYVTTSPWSIERLERRLSDIGAELPSVPFAGELCFNGTFRVIKRQDGKYWRVLSVKKIADVNPVDVDEPTGVDLSFDFSTEEVPF